MHFKEHKAIYLQIVERICEKILLGEYREEERIPSVREYAAEVAVNLNTVMRSFDRLQAAGIIFNRRGIGYFVEAGAGKKIHALQKAHFLEHELHEFFRQLQLLEIPIGDIVERYHVYNNQSSKKNEHPL